MSHGSLSHAPHFRARRAQNWVLLGLMYGFFYMSRYNFSAVQGEIAARFGWTHSDYSNVLSAGLFVYGCAVFLNGPLADRIGGKRAILIGAAGAAFFNLLFGLCNLFLVRSATWQAGVVVEQAVLADGMSKASVIATFAALWALNHYFQSFGALSIVKINAAWFHVRERGSFAGIFGIMIQMGRWLAFSMGPFILLFLPWQYVFFIPALLLLVMWATVYAKVENSPAAAGLEDFDTGDETREEAASPATLGFVLRKVFTRREPWLIALSSMCIGMVRNSVDHYYVRYFTNVFHLSNAKLSAPYQIASVAMPIAAVLGGLAAGNASDKLFGSRRAPVICLAFVGQAIGLLLLHRVMNDPWQGAAMLVLIAFFIQSAHSLVGGAASMDFGGRKAVATAAGLFDGAQYLAGALMAQVMGRALNHYRVPGVEGAEFFIWPLVPLPFAVIGAVLISRLWYAFPGKRGH